MAYGPDILVMGPHPAEILLAADIRLHLGTGESLEQAEQPLKRYMVGMRCPLGLLVTLDRMWLYGDRYVSRTEASVERIGEFSTQALLRTLAGDEEVDKALALRRLIHRWLEDLAAGYVDPTLPADLAAAARRHLLLSLPDGIVQATAVWVPSGR